jgi:predicted transposase YbfD/YdcC
MGHFAELEDPRAGNARFGLLEMMVIALCAVLCGGESCVDMAVFARSKEDFLREFLALPKDMPSHDTFSRLFRRLDPEMFGRCFSAFMASFAAAATGVIAIDGKRLRGSFDAASERSALHMVSAWGCDAHMVLGQVATDEKSNEITAIPLLLKMLSLDGCTVTIDAMGTQREIARQIVEQDGDYVLALKGNQGTLHADVRLLMEDPGRPATPFHRTVDADHGRIETRTATVETDIGYLVETHAWPGLAAVGRIVRERESMRKGEARTTVETSYFLLSEKLSPARFAEVVRAHWGIENRLHWVLDVTMNEDKARNRLDNGPENIAVLRHMALNIIEKDASTGSKRGKIKKAGWNNAFLMKLLTQN